MDWLQGSVVVVEAVVVSRVASCPFTGTVVPVRQQLSVSDLCWDWQSMGEMLLWHAIQTPTYLFKDAPYWPVICVVVILTTFNSSLSDTHIYSLGN